MRATFTKSERLCSKKIMEELFASGKSFIISPFRVIWDNQELNSAYPVQVAISVPKRNVKKAVERNRLKRQIREAYRLNKLPLYKKLTVDNKQCALMLIFTGKELVNYNETENKIKTIIQRLIREHEKNDQ